MAIRDELSRWSRGLMRDTLSGMVEAAQGIHHEYQMGRFDDYLEKARSAAVAAGNNGEGHEPAGEPSALHFDPFDLVASFGYRDKRSQLSYHALERIGRTVPVVADVIRTRREQVRMFCSLPEDDHAPGFVIKPRNPSMRITQKAKKEQYRLSQLMLTTGHVTEKRLEQQGSVAPLTLDEFAVKFVDDTLIYDQVCFEKVLDRKGDLAYFEMVDSGAIRRIDSYRAGASRSDVAYVQLLQEQIVADFTNEELAFCVRNPRSNVQSHGYGFSETESLVREITGMLYGMQYNQSFFQNGSAAKGILNFKGSLPEKHLQKFRRQWYSMVSGVSNAWRTPITNSDELQWINMQLSNRDMEYSAWLDFLIKVVCARFLIAPEEVNFSYGNTNQSQGLGSSSIEDKLKASKDLGLRPLIRFFFQQLNNHILWKINPDFMIVPANMDDKGAEHLADYVSKLTSTVLTIDEGRALLGYEPLGEDRGGDLVRDAQWTQGMMAQGKLASVDLQTIGAETAGSETNVAGQGGQFGGQFGGLGFEANSDRPPSGYEPVPNSMYGGFRKWNGQRYVYWYPDGVSPEKAADDVDGVNPQDRV